MLFSTQTLVGLFALFPTTFNIRALALPTDSFAVSDPNFAQWNINEYSLSVARSRLSAASAGNKIFFAGGILKDSSISDIIDVFDIETKTWSVQKLSSPRSEIGAGSFANGRFAVFAGGIGKETTLSPNVDVYDSQEDTWTVLKLTVPRISPRIIDLGNITAIHGGMLLSPPYISSQVDFLDSSYRITRTKKKILEYPVLGVAMSDPEDNIAIISGGFENRAGNSKFSDLQPSNETLFVEHDPIDNRAKFFKAPLLDFPRWEISGAYSRDKYVLGGGYTLTEKGDTISTDVVNVFNGMTGAWQTNHLRLTTPRHSIFAGAVRGYVLFWGGAGSNVLDVYNPLTDSMVGNVPKNLYMKTSKAEAGYTTAKGCMIAVGGGLAPESGTSDTVEILNACY
ncbi:hypothetical protein BB559_004338 [Furculomyces boomerangus]|uniref:Galactose oxidase n=2 Tax=Harpellales TaxID=61421 RepID=A0A2T9YFC2_9FUNG|nr:hypothetical protein BB559_004338 [Furculomyces boomerangus]PVZ99477.1 hypothetical protein BB558_004491 [Smittium angustum]